MIYDIIVIGAGPAGMTACLYALRSGKNVLLIESETIGGQISSSPRVENFPSIKQINGGEFANNLFEQITDLGAEFEMDQVMEIKKNHHLFQIIGENQIFESHAVVIATGVKHRKIEIEHEDELIGRGLSHCAVCDGAFYKNADVAVIGDGNSALQYALLLANYCQNVYLCTLFDRYFSEFALIEQIKKTANIIPCHNLKLQSFIISADHNLKGLNFENHLNKENIIINVEGCFIAIGQIANNERFQKIVELDHDGYIIANEDCHTSTEGIFVAGDCRTKKVRQLTTAVSDGAIAGLEAVKYLDKQKH